MIWCVWLAGRGAVGWLCCLLGCGFRVVLLGLLGGLFAVDYCLVGVN